MLFNSFRFILLFLPVVLCLALLLKGEMLLFWIALSSLLFYAWAGHPWFLIPMLVTTCLDYILARWMEDTASPARRKVILLFSMCGNLGLLVYFKYAGLFLRTADGIGRFWGYAGPIPAWFSFFNVILPAGISFYTFQTLSYMIDVYRGQAHAEKNFWKFLSFVAFFPHLVAGPLTRHHQLLPQLQEVADHGVRPRWTMGLTLFFIGLMKKVLIADRIGYFVDKILDQPAGMTAWAARLALVGYALQIYFDFSGYSEMAIGLGRLFGIELPQNFNDPYRACNPSEFWQRWHITLSQWLRDYLYIPLGGNRCSKTHQLFNLMVTMLLGGLWHGAQWTFAFWGLYHGFLLVLYHLTQSTWDRLARPLQRAFMFTLICIGWAFFRAPSLSAAFDWLALSFSIHSDWMIPGQTPLTALAALVAIVLVLVFTLPNYGTAKTFASSSFQVVLGTLTTLTLLYMSSSSKFLYFQF